jgi:FlaA1/EpsC-like NDP-sugar epimerase
MLTMTSRQASSKVNAMLQDLIFRFFEIPRVYKRAISIIVDIVFITVAMLSAFMIRDKVETWLSLEMYYSFGITVICTIIIWSRLGLYRAVIRFIDTKALSTIFVGSLISQSANAALGAFYLFFCAADIRWWFTLGD